ncbi:MAG: hypothetical protein OSW71_16785, partial [Proteobacteria bacterium]|nr:hypothetical protein [Pseudomonadota bacterium]
GSALPAQLECAILLQPHRAPTKSPLTLQAMRKRYDQQRPAEGSEQPIPRATGVRHESVYMKKRQCSRKMSDQH